MKRIFSAGFCFFIPFLLFGQDIQNSNNKKPSATIVFICEHGAARSTIAAAWFNKLAKEQGLNYRATFRGNIPDSVLGPATIKGLTKDGFDVQEWRPAAITSSDIKNAYHVVTVDCVLPEKHNGAKSMAHWKGIPNISDDYNVARDSIVKKVQALIAELSVKSKAEN